MLAFSVTCHIGIMLAGIGLLDSEGLAGTSMMLLSHAFLTGGLFLAAGILLAKLRSVDELQLRGRAGGLRWLGWLWFAGALGLVGPPFVGVFGGHALIDEAAAHAGRDWIPPLLWFASALAGAALLRAGARVFLGWGPKTDRLLTKEADEQPPKRGTRLSVLGPVTAVMIVLGLAVSVVPGLAQRSLAGADRFRDREAYAARVLHAAPSERMPRLPYALEPPSAETAAYSVAAPLLALGLATLALFRRRVPKGILRPAGVLKAVHSGVIGEYVMWLTVGTALIGSVWALTLR
jgi:multicomponent Na+:H+ antiporter subunit D